VGIFTCFIFTFQAAAFLSGEVGDEGLRLYLIKVSKISSLAMIGIGPLVFATAHWEGIPLAQKFFTNPPSIACFIISSGLILTIRTGLMHNNIWLSRASLGAQTGLVVLGAGFLQFPDIVRYTDGTTLTLMNCVAPESTQKYLFYALVFGIIVITPLLAYLFKVFQYTDAEKEDPSH
jgi:cytochrome bd-type quinol oxidase subunit 2